MRKIRIECPDTKLTKTERIINLIGQLENWISSSNLSQLLEVFGFIPTNGLNFSEKVEEINHFVNTHWDFRKNRGERWNLTNENFSNRQRELIINAAKELGLFDMTEPLEEFNYVLPLGGAGKSNYDRPVLTKETIDKINPNECSIVALSGKRPISKTELPYLTNFAKDANTEFDALTKSILNVFNLENSEYQSKVGDNKNRNLSWEIREYNNRYNNYSIYSLAAPSSDPIRRANSRDTFEFFLDKFNINNGDKVLLVTSNIYVPYQLLAFIDLAIDKGFYVDCIGSPPQNYLANYSNYLQEIKATINQINRLIGEYSNVLL